MTGNQKKRKINLNISPDCLLFEKYCYSTANPHGISEKIKNIFTKFHAHCLILEKYCYSTAKPDEKTEKKIYLQYFSRIV